MYADVKVLVTLDTLQLSHFGSSRRRVSEVETRSDVICPGPWNSREGGTNKASDSLEGRAVLAASWLSSIPSPQRPSNTILILHIIKDIERDALRCL